jgi:phenylpropionate dioxygenase-like ring-hydroxylating dioxygenase large terminal subunit
MRGSRFPFPIPLGWFHVAFDRDLKPGDIKPIKAFGRDLVLWRAESGALTLQNAYCPHLGANFGVGGEVHGEQIRCPFHHWSFGADGRVREIPYANKLNEKACVRTYPLQVKYGIVMAWYHPEGAEPSYALSEVPEFELPEFVTPIVTRHEINSCVQEMGENTADGAHFVTVHGHPGAANYDSFEFSGYTIRMKSTQLFPSSGGPVEGTLNTDNDGFGWAVIRYKTLIDITMLTTNLPVDEEHVVQYFHVSYSNPDNDPKIDRIGQAFNKEVNRQLTDDIPIWENKVYEPSPKLCDGDGPIARYRRWASQFYVEPTSAA